MVVEKVFKKKIQSPTFLAFLASIEITIWINPFSDTADTEIYNLLFLPLK